MSDLRPIYSAAGKVVSSVTETAQAVAMAFTDGTSAYIPKEPMLDLRNLINNWDREFRNHVLQQIPPAHQGFYIVDFDEDDDTSNCSGQIQGQGAITIPAGFDAITIYASASRNANPVPRGIKYPINASGSIALASGTLELGDVTSEEGVIEVTGLPGAPVTIKTDLQFRYRVLGDNSWRNATMPVQGFAQVPASANTVMPSVTLTGTITLPDGSRVTGVRTTQGGTVLTSTSSELQFAKASMDGVDYVWESEREEEKKMFKADGAAQSTLTYSIPSGTVARYSYCEHIFDPEVPIDPEVPLTPNIELVRIGNGNILLNQGFEFRATLSNYKAGDRVNLTLTLTPATGGSPITITQTNIAINTTGGAVVSFTGTLTGFAGQSAAAAVVKSETPASTSNTVQVTLGNGEQIGLSATPTTVQLGGTSKYRAEFKGFTPNSLLRFTVNSSGRVTKTDNYSVNINSNGEATFEDDIVWNDGSPPGSQRVWISVSQAQGSTVQGGIVSESVTLTMSGGAQTLVITADPTTVRRGGTLVLRVEATGFAPNTTINGELRSTGRVTRTEQLSLQVNNAGVGGVNLESYWNDGSNAGTTNFVAHISKAGGAWDQNGISSQPVPVIYSSEEKITLKVEPTEVKRREPHVYTIDFEGFAPNRTLRFTLRTSTRGTTPALAWEQEVFTDQNGMARWERDMAWDDLTDPGSQTNWVTVSQQQGSTKPNGTQSNTVSTRYIGEVEKVELTINPTTINRNGASTYRAQFTGFPPNRTLSFTLRTSGRGFPDQGFDMTVQINSAGSGNWQLEFPWDPATEENSGTQQNWITVSRAQGALTAAGVTSQRVSNTFVANERIALSVTPATIRRGQSQTMVIQLYNARRSRTVYPQIHTSGRVAPAVLDIPGGIQIDVMGTGQRTFYLDTTENETPGVQQTWITLTKANGGWTNNPLQSNTVTQTITA